MTVFKKCFYLFIYLFLIMKCVVMHRWSCVPFNILWLLINGLVTLYNKVYKMYVVNEEQMSNNWTVNDMLIRSDWMTVIGVRMIRYW